MRCWPRSTRSSARPARSLASGLLAAVLSAVIGGHAPAAQAPADTARVRQAIAAMATSRLGSHVDVEVTVTDVRMTDAEGTITAVPDQGARIGIPSRFTLFADRRRLRLGEATAVVDAVGGAVRLRRTLARSEIVGQDDVELVR